MNKQDIQNDSLYREQLLEIYKNPSNRGSLASSSVKVTEKNAFCGDVVTLELEIENGVIKDVAFDGDACMVAIASSSLLTEEIKGKTVEEAGKITKEDLLEMLGVELTTSRVKCAILILEALQSALKQL
ncbi:hypothetical protein A2886_01750 [candidate division WWE3 bacterium RIFCSPHIGHO2_01_FULL_42_13]|uniref:NIF system FeS cluster assembly NifU N-terminal domain-containing protein n=1 Tax=candidate division WWE3 bacterium RIFCSPHIGHO2_01_FULL_42_13 TaxID=1802617 RepID=A0A1F4UQQ2_UNCKA|nr:MAG: hypothetical protein A2886_01750 [candidate division WWE3 bacterium RIFCSPHIGHO2_01_FULL_42_13]